jgi:3-hydroxymyristoyl/3-hydroxydecanoyl-(acyl carrier protein) dehydratase
VDIRKILKRCRTATRHCLLIDRVIKIGPITAASASERPFNERHFSGIFPDRPVYPGVMIEAMAQTRACRPRSVEGAKRARCISSPSINASFASP